MTTTSVTQMESIYDAVSRYDPSADTGLLRRCYEFAAERHAGQLRRSGEPYVVHPVGVARIITDLRLDVPSVCAGLLHDCVEDTSATPDDRMRTEIQGQTRSNRFEITITSLKRSRAVRVGRLLQDVLEIASAMFKLRVK